MKDIFFHVHNYRQEISFKVNTQVNTKRRKISTSTYQNNQEMSLFLFLTMGKEVLCKSGVHLYLADSKTLSPWLGQWIPSQHGILATSCYLLCLLCVFIQPNPNYIFHQRSVCSVAGARQKFLLSLLKVYIQQSVRSIDLQHFSRCNHISWQH